MFSQVSSWLTTFPRRHPVLALAFSFTVVIVSQFLLLPFFHSFNFRSPTLAQRQRKQHSMGKYEKGKEEREARLTIHDGQIVGGNLTADRQSFRLSSRQFVFGFNCFSDLQQI
jgi:hypothetical protein